MVGYHSISAIITVERPRPFGKSMCASAQTDDQHQPNVHMCSMSVSPERKRVSEFANKDTTDIFTQIYQTNFW